MYSFFFSSRRRHTRCALVTGVQTCALPISIATSAMAEVDTESYRELDTFMDVFNRVKANYVDKVTDEQLIKGAIDGMLASLDPHSSYEDALDFENLRIQTEGNYGGLGQIGRAHV